MTAGLQDPWITALLGQSLGDFVLEECIGKGNFGYVFKARSVVTNSLRAVKVLSPQANADSRAEFNNEGMLLARLKGSSHVVGHYESSSQTLILQLGSPAGLSIGTAVQVPLDISYHVLELAHGVLSEILPQASALSWHEKLSLWRGAILGVHQMHLRQLVHRDLKSDNCLMFSRSKGVTDCKVSDLGRSRDLSNRPSHAPSQYVIGLGDLRFAPPEFLFIQGIETAAAHRAVDLYGLGSLLFEIVTGVGLTAMVFGDPWPILAQSQADIQRGQRTDVASLRPHYSAALMAFNDELPGPLKYLGLATVQRLCDPVPADRFPMTGLGRRAVVQHGLERLTRTADILRKLAQQADSAALNSRKKGA